MIIDVHVHLAGIGDQLYGTERCHLSKDFRESVGFKLMLLQNGLEQGDLTDEKIQQIVLRQVYESKKVDKIVLLAMDRVYDRNGKPLEDNDDLPEKTQFYTPNECVAKIAKDYPDKVIFGASVHPGRPEAEKYLEDMKNQGAKLVKWLPSSQNIDPLCSTYRSFYKKLAELKLPLLCHVGAEHTIPVPTARSKCNDWKKNAWMYTALNRPDILVPALEEGVTVIAAHCCLPVWNADPDYTYEFIRLMYTAKKNGWNLYADLSALTLPRKMCPKRYKAAKIIAAETDIHDRLILGSDFPIMVGNVMPRVVDGLSLEELKDFLGTSNPFDRNIDILRSLGFPETVFENAAKVLGIMPMNGLPP